MVKSSVREGDEELEVAREAIARWVDVLNRLETGVGLEQALSPRARMLRMGVWEQAGELAESLVGHEGGREWIRRTPSGVSFELDGEVSREGRHVFAARYVYSVDDFDNGGRWLFEVDRQGRLSWLMHTPDPIDPDTGLDKDWSSIVAEAREKALSKSHDDLEGHDHSHDHD